MDLPKEENDKFRIKKSLGLIIWDSSLTYEGARNTSAIESFSLIILETNVAPPEVTELTTQVWLR